MPSIKHPKRIIAALIALLLLGLLGWFLSQHIVWEKTTRHTGMNGQALRNPFYAGMQMMGRLGYTTRQLDNTAKLVKLSNHATLLVADAGKFSDTTQLDLLLHWVRTGGHLVVGLDAKDRDSALLKALGVHIIGQLDTQVSDSVRANVENLPMQLDLDNAEAFELENEPVWSTDLDGWMQEQPKRFSGFSSERDEETYGRFVIQAPRNAQSSDPTDTASFYARVALGNGYVTFGKLGNLSNREISKFDHSQLFVRLLTLPDDKRPIYMILAPEYPSLLAWLTQHAPEALLACLALMLGCAWHFAPRFGPMLPAPDPARPGLREHLSASGSFLLKAKAYEALIAPLREEVSRLLTHLQNRHPELRTQHDLGAAISGIDANEIARALAPEPDTAQEFLRRSHTLAELRKHCQRMRQSASAPGTET